MAEYILKTELPIMTCRVCPFAEHTPFGTACPIKRGSEKRYGTCPLVELADHHGNLKDEKTIKDAIKKRLGIKYLSCLLPAEKVIVACIEQAPAVLETSE